MSGLVRTVRIDVSGIHALVTEAKKRNISLAGAKAAAKLLLKEARAQAPRRKGSGALKQAQGVKAAKARTGTASYAVQGSRKKVVKLVRLPGRTKPTRVVPAFYDHLVQLGTRAHSIRKGSALARRGKGDVGQGGSMHPGAKANPFRKRAWERVKVPAARAAVAAMGKATQKEIARQHAKVMAKARAAR